MNLIDLVLLVGVAGAAGWGAKRGFIRMIMVVAGLVAAIVIAVHYNDYFSRELASYFRASPLWVSMIAFVLSSMILFALFRLAAKMFFRVASLQKLGKQDQFGGALMGVLFGWLIMGYLIFLVLFLPLPITVEEQLENSLLGLKMGASVPFVYETTARLHPSQDNFVVKMEDSLDGALESTPGKGGRPAKIRALDRARVADFLDRIDRYFASGD